MGNPPLAVGVVGFGYWGPNLVRNFTAFPGARVVAIADRDPRRLDAARTQLPWVGAWPPWRSGSATASIARTCGGGSGKLRHSASATSAPSTSQG